ncbi:PDZ domain-containing protein [Aliikangiella coralliicola]|uniref:PDZ domain-containing protein n=1 Tax=Aliikangiella coralliicola TaxID=2592383 RepID=A0A545UJ52_9GAMM|nr:PDZ domain-containing protein [Aliikangiella coralliicola]TQV89463.1 PDZ domain-containing protein [Aliikangiella coralliicola]
MRIFPIVGGHFTTWEKLMRFIHSYLIALLFCLTMSSVYAESFVSGDLVRKASPGFRVQVKNNQLLVSSVSKQSAAEKAGLVKGSQILDINGKAVTSAFDGKKLLRNLVGGSKLNLKVSRGNRTKTIKFVAEARPLEAIPGADSYYDVVNVADDARLRTIVSVPAGVKSKRPAIFFVQWVSCGSLEYRGRGVSDAVFSHLIVEAKRTLIRVERSSDGDSEGAECHELDYNTELEHYYQAFKQLRHHRLVDTKNIVIYGSSLGSTVAPLLAEKLMKEGIPVAGVMVQGGGGVTYLERMLAFERIYLERRPEVKPESIHNEIYNRTLFYTEYLIKGRMPDDIAKDSADMKVVRNSIRGLAASNQYGRPFAWHQQAAQHNFLKAWANVKAPVLVVFNEFDQFETAHGHKVIVDMVNRWRPGTATFVEGKNIGHSGYQFDTIEQAYAFEDAKPVPEKMNAVFTKWLPTTIVR